MSLVIRPAAAAEIEEAFLWYEGRRTGLGAELLVELETVAHSILENPRLYPVIWRGTRRALLHRFPYGVFYREKGDDIVVLAFFHGSRDPRIWRRRS